MDYISVTQAAGLWGISARRIQTLCGQGRIPGASRVGVMWLIPAEAAKPADARLKSGRYIGKSAQRAVRAQQRRELGID